MSNVLLGFASGENMGRRLGEFDMVVINISRREVMEGAVGDVVDRLMQLSDSRETTLKFASSVAVVFEGWDEDERELCEIPEVVAFFKKVNESWSYWYHFLIKEQSTWQWFLSMVLETEAVVEDGVRRKVLKHPGKLQKQLLSFFTPMNALYEMHGIGEAENKKMTAEVVKVLEGGLG